MYVKWLLLLLIVPLNALAQAPQHSVHNKPPEQTDSTLTWEELNNLDIKVETPAPLQTIFHVSFPQALTARNGTAVKIKGFMYPLKAGEAHDYFLLSALPPSCPFCLPGGQTTLIEVKCAEPIAYTLEPILLEGTFELLKDDPSGLYYRLIEARAVN
jgi:hypothetical protein